ncbi:MAG: hypothetical protein Q9185_005001 [Variospora sp. 1 TL-2023]
MPPRRLINTTTYELYKNGDAEVKASPHYAILSHRWGKAEVTFQMLTNPQWRESNLGAEPMKKIREACKKARDRDTPIEWLWCDTCCIDKNNSEELRSSIDSMFEWYRKATVCYGYLTDVDWDPSRQQMSKSVDRPNQESVWFERGWTLQELLAPRYMEFFDRNWTFMGTRDGLSDKLQSVTGIAKKYLTGAANFKQASVATRMGWMAGRTTTEIEDIAYSMLGLLDISMPIYYGEGVKAFMRLQRTLIESSWDESLFAWTTPANGLTCYRRDNKTPVWAPNSWGLLAPSPDCFSRYRDLVVLPDLCVPRLSGSYKWVQRAIQFAMPMKSGTEVTNFFGRARKEVTLPLNCWRQHDDGKSWNVNVKLRKNGHVYSRIDCDDVVEKRGSKPSTNSVMGVDQVVTRPLTVAQPDEIDLELLPMQDTQH